MERAFAIIDLFQGVLEPPELFLQVEREKKFIVFLGSPWMTSELPSHPPDKTSFESALKQNNPPGATCEILNLEIRNSDREPGILLIIQHELERKYQSTVFHEPRGEG